MNEVRFFIIIGNAIIWIVLKSTSIVKRSTLFLMRKSSEKLKRYMLVS